MILVIKSIIMQNSTCGRIQFFLAANELLDTNRYTAEMI